MHRSCLVCLLFVACGGPGPVSPPAEHATADAGATSVVDTSKCPDKLDIRDLLARNAKGYGAQDDIGAALPLTLTYDVAASGKTGVENVVMDIARWRSTTQLAGLDDSFGVDERGPWSIGQTIGVLVRPTGEHEATSLAYEDWLLRRRYLASAPTSSTCELRDGTPLVTLVYQVPEMGSPTAVFNFTTAELVRTTHVASAGRHHVYEIAAWSPPDARHVRWPAKVMRTHEASDPTTSTLRSQAPGFQCPHPEDVADSSCIRPPAPALSITWPKGSKVVLPFRYVGGELLIEVSLDGRKVWAMLDSGAGISVVDGEMPAAKTFHPAIEVTGTGSSQTLKFGLGELPRVEVGGIVFLHLPVASVPIPALAAFGATRPEIILGYSLFVGAAIRVDYEHTKIEFARAADSLLDGLVTTPLSLEDLEGKLIAKATIEGHPASVELDTGSNTGWSFFKSWTDEAKLTEGHKTLAVTVHSGAGTAPTEETVVRVKTATLGPIQFNDSVANISNPPGMGIVAGLVGNPLFARCASVTFDHAHRTLWLEGTCARPLKPEPMTGMHMTRKEDSLAKGLPWVVEAVEPGGPADHAGIVMGDRLLSVDGKPASGDVEAMHAALDKPEGATVTLELRRGAEKKKLSLTLAPTLK